MAKKFLSALTAVSFAAVSLIVLFTSVTAFAMTPEEDAAWKKEPAYGRAVRVGYEGGLCLSSFGIAQIKGFYAAEGLTTEIVKFQGGSSAYIDAVGIGKVDISGAHITMLLIPAVNGVRMKFTTGIHTGCKSLCVLASGDIKTTKDLIGKTIAVPDGIGMADQNITMRFLSHDGLDPLKDVKYKVVEGGAAVMALETGEIQAVMLGDQFMQKFLDNGTLRVIRSITQDDDFKDETCCIHVVNLDFYEQNPITVKKLTRAHENARRWMMENREESIKLLQKNGWAPGNSELVQRIFNTFDYSVSDETTEATLRKIIDDYKAFGLIQSTAATDELLNRVWDPVLAK